MLASLVHSLLHAFALPERAHASWDLINQTVNNVGATLPTLTDGGCDAAGGACGFVDIALGVIHKFRPLLAIIGVLSVGIFGVRMVIGQEDDVRQKARPLMTALITGIILAYLIEPMINAFYGTSGEIARGGMAAGAAIATTEVNGVINWALVVMASVAILIIVLTALTSILKVGNEEGIASIRRTLTTVVIGILLITFRQVLGGGIVNNTRSPIPILTPLLQIISYIMGFLALAATAAVVFAGIQMILSFGNAEQAQKAKAFLGRAVIGFIVIIVSLAIVNFVILPGVS